MCRFFEDYKKNEHKDVKVDDILGAAEAMKCVKDSLNMYQVRSSKLNCLEGSRAGRLTRVHCWEFACCVEDVGAPVIHIAAASLTYSAASISSWLAEA
jgi:hypothetical protein